MPVSDICKRNVVTVPSDTTVFEAAKLMRQYHVGDVVVVMQKDGINNPVGIVTDRDIVVEVIATELDARVITVGDITVSSLAVVHESSGVLETFQAMAEEGVRRMPVINTQGDLIGIVTLDDLLLLLGKEFDAIPSILTREQRKEAERRH
ncbi:MAG TPA: CBS domain-containing protein [Methylophilaceae bacterium]|nr:CBS domain-containing protein [Methylophilaceae bacterium]